jgi:alpha-L-rhamnosidase
MASVVISLAALLGVSGAERVGAVQKGEAVAWGASWIGRGRAVEPRPAPGVLTNSSQLTNVMPRVDYDGRSVLLRKTFVAMKPVRHAVARVTGLGYFEFYCNGQRLGEDVLAPAVTNYRKRILYETFDLADLIRPGTNVVGIMLGNGWFNPAPKWWDIYRMPWYGSKRALAQIEMEFADGSRQSIVSDDSWKTSRGPVIASCVFDGETYDANAEQAGWERAGFDDRAWDPARAVESPGGVLVPGSMPAIRVMETLKPVRITEPKPGVFVVDFGQNFAGWARVSASAPRGTRLTLRYAEDVKPNGMIDTTSNEKAAATDVYIMKGEGTEVYEPRFTFQGFRYLEVTGYPGTPREENFLGCVVHSSCEPIGEFECDNELLNRIHKATCWSQRGNMVGYPMDCPQRDERLGWFGDAMVSMEEAMFNFDMAGFYRHWLTGVQLDQSERTGDISIVSPRPYVPDEPDPTWSSAYLVMVWQFYVHYGDREILAQHYDSMRRYADFLQTQATNHILPKYWIGDWGSTVKGWKEGEPVSVVTAFYYYDVLILAKAAGVLGKRADAARYRSLAGDIRRAFIRTFYEPKGKNFEQGTQFSNAFPLFLGLVPAGDEEAVVQNILRDIERNSGHFTVGVLGAKYLLEALTMYGRADAAYRLVTQTGYPSWAHLLEGGRTTLGEFWDLHGSHNHVMLGSVDGWFFNTLAGIQPDERYPGFEHFQVKPFVPQGLNKVRASTRTVRGLVAVEWEKVGRTLKLNLTVPRGSRATVQMPVDYSTRIASTPPLKPRKSRNGTYIVAEAGTFEIRGEAGLGVSPIP